MTAKQNTVRKLLFRGGILHLMLAIVFLQTKNAVAQNDLSPKNQTAMKMNAGIVTTQLAESKKFYTEVLGFGIVFENEFFLLMHTPDHEAQISFLLPDHPTQQPLFHKSFQGQGMYLTIEVDNVDEMYDRLKKKGIDILIELRDEPWGDRHFAIKDPNGVGIDIVTYNPPK